MKYFPLSIATATLATLAALAFWFGREYGMPGVAYTSVMLSWALFAALPYWVLIEVFNYDAAKRDER